MLIQGMFVGDRYEIIGKIGAGGMSDVYKAKDHTLGRFVAIKVLKSEFSEDINFVTKFRSEAQSAAGLEHPNIVNIYDVGSENEIHYIVMEYVEGITLKTYIEKKGQLTFKEAASIAIQVGRGIETAHNKNIVHRDIKPQNIMISTEGKVKVMDFGIARAATSNTINSDVMGSVHYSSPEQARNGFVDGKSDIYSLGIVMYEMVTGRVPFNGDTTVQVAIQHLQEEMVTPSVYAPNLPISMEKIILKCTQKNSDRRYESMTALLADLRKSLVSPNEDFVVIAPVSQEKTRIIGEEEVSKIRQKSASVMIREEDLLKNAMREEKEEYEEEVYEEEEDDDDDELNPKMDKAITIMGIAAGLVILALIAFILISFFGDFKFGKKGNEPNQQNTETETEEKDGVEVPDLRGYTYDEAKAAVNKLGLGIKPAGTVSSNEYEEGQIVSQTPAMNESVAKNTTIEVTISSGAGEISIPDVTMLDETAAYDKLSGEDFIPVKEYAYDAAVPQGKVISQSPVGNTLGKKGDTVKIIISRGAETAALVSVPDLYNVREDIAKQTLTNAGLTPGSTTSQYHPDVPAGNVVSQDVAHGTQVNPGTVVNLTVSLGAEPGGSTVEPNQPPTTTYQISLSIKKPENSGNVAAANIYLYDAANGTGTIIDQWTNQSIALFGENGLTISKKGIATPSGSILIEWLDAEGTVIGNPQIQNLDFKPES